MLREYERPRIDVENTDYGLRLIALRKLDEARTHVRVTNLIFPHAVLIPLSETMTITQWHVPVDDENCYWYAIFTSFRDPVNKDEMRRQRLELYELPDYKPRVNRHNDWGYNAAEQKTKTFTGMGDGHQRPRQLGGREPGPHPRPHPRASWPDRQGDLGLSPHPARRHREGEAGEVPLLSRHNGHELPITVDGIAPANEWDSTGGRQT